MAIAMDTIGFRYKTNETPISEMVWDDNIIRIFAKGEKHQYATRQDKKNIAEIKPEVKLFGTTLLPLRARIDNQFDGSIEDTIGSLIEYQKSNNVDNYHLKDAIIKEVDTVINALLKYRCR